MAFQDYIGKLFMITIVVLGLFIIIYDTQATNNAINPLSNEPVFNDTLHSMEDRIKTSSSEMDQQYDSFVNENPPDNFISIILQTIVSFGKTTATLFNLLISLIIKLPVVVLGIPPTLVNLISTWILITLVVLLWILYKIGV